MNLLFDLIAALRIFVGSFFYRLVQQALQVDPVPGKKLKGHWESTEEDNFDTLASNRLHIKEVNGFE
jgi:hypothetical protein